ncbi:MAG: Mfa1 family fimbria major subunit [Lachnospiraceae bacterium]|nr:Mfa1 family fimbria major subunit [Lachnospiraceae bacterium]
MNKIFMGVAAVAAMSMAACSNDEPTQGGTTPNEPAQGEALAYMSVTLNDVSALSRGTAGDFENGTKDEYAVKDAYFYFYTAEGAYVTTAEVWNDGEATTPNQYVEFKGKTVLVLKDLAEKSAPKYIVTVLNKPADFEPGATLQAMEEKLAYTANGVENYMSGDYFVMSTSSFDHEGTVANTYEYFTTEVSADAFIKYPYGQEPNADDLAKLQPVEIFVERLAAKVGVSLSLNGENIETDAAGNKYAKLTVSKGEEVNNGNGASSYPIAETDLYVKIEGWGLNNLAKNEYMMKNLLLNDNASKPDGFKWAGWNAKQFNRSYWAKSFVYGAASYDSNIAHYALKDYATVKTDEAGEITTAVFSGNHLAGGNLYCAENTNRASVLATGENLGAVATNAMIFARIYEKDAEGNFAPATMVSYNGIMYDDADFVAMVLNAVQNTTATGAKKFAVKTVEGENTSYAAISADDIELTAGQKTNKGQVTVALNAAAAAKTWVSYTGEMNESTEYADATAADVNAALNNVIANVGSAYCYNGGLMYYNVPIEHFGPKGDDGSYEEGFYGVVRNHKYQLSVSSLTKLGKAIYDPEEVIIPDTPKEEERYALGVRINILSWKIVNQNVEL